MIPLRKFKIFLTALIAAIAWCAVPRVAHADKLRELVEVAGARDNQLIGYGIVSGLSGTGDDFTVPFSGQSILSLLRRLGVQIDPTQLQQMRLKNAAAVVVTAVLPPFAKSGTKIDVTASSIGNAQSLSGGVLIQTVLKGPDQRVYAVAQGSMLVGGFSARGASGTSINSGLTTAGRIVEGAIVEREVPTTLVADGALRLELRTPGFTVSSRIAEAINREARSGDRVAARRRDGLGQSAGRIYGRGSSISSRCSRIWRSLRSGPRASSSTSAPERSWQGAMCACLRSPSSTET